MKQTYYKNRGFTLVQIMIVLAIIGILAACTLSARADIYSNKGQYFTNSVTGPLTNGASFTVASNATVTVNSDPIALRSKGGIGLGSSVIATNNLNVGSVTNTYDIGTIIGSPGNVVTTNWTTTHPLSQIITTTGTNTAIVWANTASTTLDNASLIRWAQSINGNTNTVTVSGWANWSLYAP